MYFHDYIADKIDPPFCHMLIQRECPISKQEVVMDSIYRIAGNFCGDFNLAIFFTKSPKLIPPNTQAHNMHNRVHVEVFVKWVLKV